MTKIEDIQAGCAKYWVENQGNFKCNEPMEEEFELTIKSGEIQELQYFMLLIQSIRAINPHFQYSVKLRHKLDSNTKAHVEMKKDDWFRIRMFLSSFQDELPKNRFSIDISSPYRFIDQNEDISRYLMNSDTVPFWNLVPLIPINEETYLFLSQAVKEAYPSKGTYPSFSDRVHKIAFEKASGKRDIRLLRRICWEYLFKDLKDPKSKEFKAYLKARKAHYQSPEFYNRVKDLPVLSLLIFGMQNYWKISEAVKDIRKKSKALGKGKAVFNAYSLKENGLSLKADEDHKRQEHDDEETLMSALDMADGLIQIIENVVVHAGVIDHDSKKKAGGGLMSLRLYQREGGLSSTWKQYVEKRYPNYLAGHDKRRIDGFEFDGRKEISSYDACEILEGKNLAEISLDELRKFERLRAEIEEKKEEREKCNLYLEVQLLDHSGKSMHEVFVNSLKSRGDKSFQEVEETMGVSTFFNPGEIELDCWKRYVEKGGDNVVRHYGLQLFDALLKSLDACLIVQSSSSTSTETFQPNKDYYTTSGDKHMAKEIPNCFAGTQYTLLLPFLGRERKTPDYGFVNVAIQYDLPTADFEKCPIHKKPLSKAIKEELAARHWVTQEKKLGSIRKVADLFGRMEHKERDILLIDLKRLAVLPANYEVLAKALFLFISRSAKPKINIAITNCNHTAFILLMRGFALLYDRRGRNKFFRQAQIYLLDEDAEKSFLLAGGNIKNTVVAQMKQESSSKTMNRVSKDSSVNFLKKMLSLRPGEGEANTTIEYIPFNLLLDRPKGETPTSRDDVVPISVFEHGITEILEENVQSTNLGCLLSDSHMRIGSTIHVNPFYEAVLLFSKSDYIRGFSWLLQAKIKEDLKGSEDIPSLFGDLEEGGSEDIPSLFERASTSGSEEILLLFVGYGVYSEMLLRELTKYFDNAEYCIFEHGVINPDGTKEKDQFSHTDSLKENVTYKPIYIVPIVSTLSTFDKLQSAFHAELVKDKSEEKGIILAPESKPSYWSVVQTRVRSDREIEQRELEYFSEVDIEKKTIKSRILNGATTHYLFSLQHDWEDPLTCSKCYPSNFLNERPLIETDKVSVVPAQLFGRKDEVGAVEPVKPRRSGRVCGTIDDLKKEHVRFGHIERGGNHFEYYIETERLFEDSSDKKIGLWLEKEVKESIYLKDDKTVHFDYIVCSEHFSNKGFVMLVNEVVFGGAASIISVDAEREFRDNFRTKHSDLKTFYRDLAGQKQDVEMNFHYVDDGIVHGKTFFRVKNLMQSLFEEKSPFVKRRLFHSIILLIDRNSTASKRKFIDDTNKFYAFLSLNISSQRNHADACTLCREHFEAGRIRNRSSHNMVSDYFLRKAKESESKTISRGEEHFEGTAYHKREKERAFRKMVATHNINHKLAELSGGEKNSETHVFNTFCKIVNEKTEKKTDALEHTIAYLRAFSSPFISYRKAAREAALLLLILCFEATLTCTSEKDIENVLDRMPGEYIKHEDNIHQAKTLLKGLKTMAGGKTSTRSLLKLLMRQSSLLKSSYIIRKENINNILAAHPGDSDFVNYYICCVKRLLVGGKDDAKSLFLEYLILSDAEPMDANKSRNAGKIIGETSFNKMHRDFLEALYLENTQILLDASEDFYKKKGTEDIESAYYLKDYKQVLTWSGDNHADISKHLWAMQKAFRDKDPKDPIGTFQNISKCFISLLQASLNQTTMEKMPDILFLNPRTQSKLVWDKGGTTNVENSEEEIWDSFADNSEDTNALKNRKRLLDEVNKCLPSIDRLTSDTYHIDGDLLFVRLEQKKKITLVVKFAEEPEEVQKLKALRYILMFRSQLEFLISNSLDNQLDKILEEEHRKREFAKVRSAFHMNNDRKISKKSDPARYPNKVFIQNSGKWRYVPLDADISAYKQYLNALLGQINIQILAEDDNWSTENELSDTRSNAGFLKELCTALSSIGFLPSWNGLSLSSIPNLNGKEGNDAREALKIYFEELFKDKVLRKNPADNYPPFRYIVAFVADILETAANPSIKPEGEKADVSFYALEGSTYFTIRYHTRLNYKHEIEKNIEEALARKSDGISLATICGFFESFYGDATVKIQVEDGYCKIYLPLFR